MIKHNNYNPNRILNGRKDSYESTTSSAGSHNFRSTNDFDPTTATIEKSPNKYKLLPESKIRKSVRKLNNLKLLGLLKVKETQIADGKVDLELFKKTFKVNQKGLNFDNQQYFLHLNATISNNHLIRQSSPIERLKVNLYDDERTNPPQSNQSTQATNYTYETPLNMGQQQNIFGTSQQILLNNQKKRVAFRRRSCYCNQTGKQSQKSLKVDFLLPTNLIKNRIFQRMKKKQEMKMNLNDKDMIIQNLNRTFDIQEKNSARGSAINSPNLLSSVQQQFNFNENTPYTPQSGRGTNTPNQNSRSNNQIHSHSNQVQRSQFSYITSPKNGTSTNKKKEETPSNQYNNVITPVNRPQNNKPTFAETILYIKEEQNLSSSKNQSPSLDSKQKLSSSHKRDKSDQFVFRKDTDQFASRTHSRKNLSSNKNSPKNSNMAIASPNRMTPNSNRSSAFFNNTNSQYNTSAFGNFLTAGKTIKDEQQQRQQFDMIYPVQAEKRKKWLAKLRMATKLVGIQEKQRKKSFLYHQDYYKALEEVANNETEQEHKEENTNHNQSNQEKKLVLVRKVKNDKNNHHIQMFNTIITQHNLKFNSTVTSFVEKRAKSYNTLLPLSNTSIPTISVISQNKQKRSHLVSPFNSESCTDIPNNHNRGDRIDAYLKPLPVIHSPSPKPKVVHKKQNDKNPLLLFSSYSKKSKSNKDSLHRKLNQTDQLAVYRCGSHQQINSTTLSELNNNCNNNNNNKHVLSMTGFSQPNKTAIHHQGQLNNSQESLDEFQINNHLDQKQQQEASKSSLGQISNNDKTTTNQKSINEIASLDQLGRYETYYTKQQQMPKMSQTTTCFKPQTKTQQKFELLLNSQSMKNSYLFKSPNAGSKPISNLFTANKSLNQSRINFRNSSQPDILQSAFKNDHSQVSSHHQSNTKIPSQSQNKQNYLQAKFESKGNRKSVLQSYMV